MFIQKNICTELFKTIQEFNVGGILVGLPLLEFEKKSRSCQMIEDITKNINKYLNDKNNELPIFLG